LEAINKWAESQSFYSFTDMGQQDNHNMRKTSNPASFKDLNTLSLFIKGKSLFGNNFIKQIITDMRKIGYFLSGLDYMIINDDIAYLTINEEDIDGKLLQFNLSQGMFRALALIIHFVYTIMSKTSATMLIDDIGEGLDFDRSTRLIHLLIDEAEKDENDIQLIMSTNDRQVMNGVKLDYWQVLDREGGHLKVYNARNSAEKFKEFKLLGLSPFDFLRFDYINGELVEEKEQ
jgi:hypothetical protein